MGLLALGRDGCKEEIIVLSSSPKVGYGRRIG
jgi:hypothetical protein